ncbi:MAG TPA: aldehyde dehydrogenase family protein [Sandaracinaceae bacterium LLY-WYZ-13_1]|nr:aldehyde dehydrogenase family protein [Sandaracinaceae bacterium LLY-WYZ-13_1]
MKMLLKNEWVDRDETIDVTDPQTGKVLDTIPQATERDVSEAIGAAVKGARTAYKMGSYARATVLRDTANLVEARAEDFAETIASEGVKTIREARKEVARCVNVLNVCADASKHIEGETITFDSFPGGENRKGWYERVPLGVISAITPFNDPLNLVAHKVGPSISAGNATVLKPATSTPLSALKLVETLQEAGLPPLVVQTVTGDPHGLGNGLFTDDRVAMVSFTGGVSTGKKIASMAGLKKLGMELGSNCPVIVWEDADVPWAVESCVSGAFWAAGQNCIGVQRLYVHEKVYDRFAEAFVEETKKLKLGSKLDEGTDMGVLIDQKAAERVKGWIDEAAEKGAKILTGGERDGTTISPTVLEGVPKDASAHCEEVFGPTVNLYRVSDLDEAIDECNDVPYGIHAAIFTTNLDVAYHAYDELHYGGVMVNDSTDYRLDAMPFGGVKESGMGREGVRFSVREMTEPKVACWKLSERYKRR